MTAGAAVSRTSGFVAGTLEKGVPTGAAALTFEIGTGSDSTPIDIAFTDVTIAGTLTAFTTATDHPSIATAHLFADKTVNRFYTLSASGTAFDDYEATFTFVPGDVDAGADPGNFVLQKFNSGTWSRPILTGVTPTSISATGLTSFSDFQIGEPDTVASISVQTAHADGSFGVGEVIDLSVQYEDAVTVTGGTPSIDLNSVGTAIYLGGSGTDTLTFRYTVSAGENSADLDYTSVAALSLNGSAIRDADGGDTDATLPGVGTFSGAHAIEIDTYPPFFSGVTPLSDSIINSVTSSSQVGYTLNEDVAVASITIARTGGTADPDAPYVCQLNGSALISGSHLVDFSDTVNGCGPAVSLVNGAAYSFTFEATDLVGNLAGTVSSTNVTFDVMGPPVIIPPATSGSRSGLITVIKTVINDNGGKLTLADFPIFVNGVSVASGVTNAFRAPADVYTVTETANPSYLRTFSGDCDVAGGISLNPGDNKICIITNNDVGAPADVPPVPPILAVVTVPSPLDLPEGPGPVTYAYTLRNLGTVPITDITVIGDFCTPIVFISGDINQDSKLDVKETWAYRCSARLSETRTNTVVATGWSNGLSTADVAISTVIVGLPILPPLIHVTNVPSPLILPTGGGLVTYTQNVSNPGGVALSNIRLTDDTCSPMVYAAGDANNNAKLDTNETWTYVCRTALRKTTSSTTVAFGEANGFMIKDFAIITVVVATAVPGFPDTGLAQGLIASILELASTIDIDKSLIAPAASASVRCGAGTLVKLANDGDLETQMDSTVYNCGIDGKRYVFPDAGTYFSWFKDFANVQIVSGETLAFLPLAGNVTYEPGSRLLKIESDPRVYAVAKGGVLRWLTTEAAARAMYGDSWNKMISDIPASLFGSSYSIGESISLADLTSGSEPIAKECEAATTFTTNLVLGSTDPHVRSLQDLLRCLGYFPQNVATNGRFGAVTQDAVLKFQSANNLTSTGTAGRETREALNLYTTR